MILLIHLYFVLICFSRKHIFSYFIYLPTYVLTYLHMKEVSLHMMPLHMDT